ncbi:hypothetical protein B0I35DRAFT_379516 [Stachybotrys elegans]|uniref:Uncharacterized protein n=1 Tax=Stachybotrys elegans TaxID=80388 RepID=A0A8K0WMS4_9HYPO|nr:hypothetical protein B0I35DRAFT_379516 [Stachybotrys elegans]
MARLVALALYHRDSHSEGHARQAFGYSAYHWAIIATPEASKGHDYYIFDATDRSDIDPVTFRLNNPTMGWWFRVQRNVDPNDKLLGQMIIGRIAEDVSLDHLTTILQQVPLPTKNTYPQQDCVTWAMNAIRVLQEHGWVRDLNLKHCKDQALAYADDRMKGESSHTIYYQPRN